MDVPRNGALLSRQGALSTTEPQYILSTFKIFKIKSDHCGPMLIECPKEQNILEM